MGGVEAWVGTVEQGGTGSGNNGADVRLRNGGGGDRRGTPTPDGMHVSMQETRAVHTIEEALVKLDGHRSRSGARSGAQHADGIQVFGPQPDTDPHI